MNCFVQNLLGIISLKGWLPHGTEFSINLGEACSRLNMVEATTLQAELHSVAKLSVHFTRHPRAQYTNKLRPVLSHCTPYLSVISHPPNQSRGLGRQGKRLHFRVPTFVGTEPAYLTKGFQ